MRASAEWPNLPLNLANCVCVCAFAFVLASACAPTQMDKLSLIMTIQVELQRHLAEAGRPAQRSESISWAAR